MLGVDSAGIRSAIAEGQKLSGEGRLPLVALASTGGDTYFVSEGYTIGLGDQIATLVTRL